MGGGAFNLDPGGAVALGVIVGLVSTCVQSVGLTLQRKSHMLEDEKIDDLDRRPPYKRRRWQIGMLLFLVANIVGSTIQIVALPLPLLSTLQASGLVFNSILASLLLKEPWTWRTACGTILVAAGAVLISYFSAVPEPSHSLQQLLVLLGKTNFLVWFILSLLFVLGVIVMTFCLRYFVPAHRKDTPRILLINGMAFGLISGILSAHALLLAKSAVELVVRSLTDRNNQFKTFEPWLLLLAFLILSLSQLYYLHLGLKLISTSILYPFVFCIYNIVAILDGLIYFQQLDRLPPLSAGLIALGTFLLLDGVLALSLRLHDDEDEDDHPHHLQTEIPQTLLAPGSGFVADPDTESSESASIRTDDDMETEREINEHTSLIRKSLDRSRTTTNKVPNFVPGHMHVPIGRRRHRAATLKDVKQIWEALEDSEDHYGTFDRPSSSNTFGPGRPASAGQQRQRRRRRSSIGKPLEPSQEPGISLEPDEQRASSSRASTMPARSSRSRRRSKAGSALFSDLLKSDWWLFKRKADDDDDDDNDGGASGSASQSPARERERRNGDVV
ncbi:uncharacterized protein MYCFIDRAFT_213682 [Pseudocercospora fijiensis CIRAD86]|uniref:DUF803 domain-containing protein n=1 Tax=Pseudocercospora fijiensis (strain CIRAD86) TaxID=383855 RepID=N1Q9B4_PSEFD|nr:uncharacterized protein MYCFIDRAFT_213682 [Pseudocercospora fijiensis CIRAD86]EME89464.1 hypothetical protein MYCFIDRAFT_213682 [Pseudocercospora fijiensis CIRAD86]